MSIRESRRLVHVSMSKIGVGSKVVCTRSAVWGCVRALCGVAFVVFKSFPITMLRLRVVPAAHDFLYCPRRHTNVFSHNNVALGGTRTPHNNVAHDVVLSDIIVYTHTC